MNEQYAQENADQESQERGEPQKVSFVVPKGFTPPEGSEGGKDFDLVCTFRPESDGKLCLVKLGDTDMPGYDGKDGSEAEKTDSKPDYSQYAQGIASQMGGEQQ